MTLIATPCSIEMVKCENFDPNDPEQFIPQAESSHRRRPAKKVKQPIEQYAHFVALVVDEHGNVHLKSSTSLRSQRDYLLEPAYHRLMATLAGRGFHAGDEGKISTSIPFQRPAKRHRANTTQETPRQGREPRDERADIRALTAQDQKKVEISVCDIKSMHGWFCEAFKAVQQVGCRTIAKVWIKKIHPKKQSTHPYNGGYPRNEPADSNRTKPPYWPEGIKHKEPDHIDRNARTALLVHLIMHTPQPQILACIDSSKQEMISARDLLKSLEEKRGEFKAGSWTIVQHIIQARTFMEQYENGEIVDPNFMICLPDYSDTSRLASGESETDIADAEEEELDLKQEVHPDQDEILSNCATLHSPRMEETNDEFNKFSNVASSFPSVFDPPMTQQVPQQQSQCAFESSDVHRPQPIVMLQPVSDATSLESVTAIRNLRPDLLGGVMQDQASAQLTMLDQQDSNATIHHLSGNHWLPTYSQDVFVHSPYSLTTMPLEDHRNFNHNATHMARHNQLAAVSHDISLLDTNGCQEYSPDMQRTLPLRTMSNTHPGMLLQGAHEPNGIRGSFYMT